MTRPRSGAAALVLLLALFVAGPASAKPRHHKCKRTQATVTVAGKKSCKPINAVFPKPRPGDERIAAWKTVLNPAPKLRDRRGRKLPSLARSFGNPGRKIYAAMVATMPEGFARLDALAEPPSRHLLARPSASAAGCGGSRIPKTESFTGKDVGGITVSGSAQTSDRGKSIVFRAKSGDKFVRTSVEEISCAPLDLPQ